MVPLLLGYPPSPRAKTFLQETLFKIDFCQFSTLFALIFFDFQEIQEQIGDFIYFQALFFKIYLRIFQIKLLGGIVYCENTAKRLLIGVVTKGTTPLLGKDNLMSIDLSWNPIIFSYIYMLAAMSISGNWGNGGLSQPSASSLAFYEGGYFRGDFSWEGRVTTIIVINISWTHKKLHCKETHRFSG